MKICVDSCFLIALYDESDQLHMRARECYNAYFENARNRVVLPWPVMYESISTRMARARSRMDRINAHLKTLRVREQLLLLDDTEFRDDAMGKCFAEASAPIPRSLSLVDLIVREMLIAKTFQIQALATFNVRDFRDVCEKFKKKIIPIDHAG